MQIMESEQDLGKKRERKRGCGMVDGSNGAEKRFRESRSGKSERGDRGLMWSVGKTRQFL